MGAVDGLFLAPFRSRGGFTVEAVATWSARTYGLSTPSLTLARGATYVDSFLG